MIPSLIHFDNAVNFNNGWNVLIKRESEKEYYKDLISFLEEEYDCYTVYPPKREIYNAFTITPFEEVKVVILGQDPYHEEGQAMGLSFSVPDGIKIPRSLQNIYKEIEAEYGYDIPNTGNLTGWARQGVLLLNTVLTVRSGEAASHQKKGWEMFTDEVLKEINKKESPVVFILWGNFARSKRSLIKGKNHLILEAAHPSPLSASRGFFGCNHFKLCNEFLKNHGCQEINWEIK